MFNWLLNAVCLYVVAGQTVLTGPTESVCPGDLLVYTCERTGVTSPNTLIFWDLLLNETNVLRANTPVRVLNESMSVQPPGEIRTILTGNFSSSGTVVAVLQVNASSDFNMVRCIIIGATSTLPVSVRGE